MKKVLLLLFLSSFLFLNTVFSQNGCGTYDGYLQDEINKYPSFYQSISEKNIKLEKENKILLKNISEKENNGELKIIPVVVHIIHDFGAANITDADVDYALDQLNKNINRQADNMLSTPDVFAAVSGSANVEFRLAKIDPYGNPTNGIVRIHSELTEVPVNDAGNNIIKTLSYWNSYSYFNIWVISNFPPQSDGNTLLGYAQFPWSGSMSTDGVAIKASEFKNGRTLTHECGHWLGLRHVWGDALCGDDNVFDTPVAKEENWNVPISAFPHNLNVCVADSINPAGEMFMNYMDYSDDNVMSLFTDGQVAIMNETLEVQENGNIAFRRYIWSEENIDSTGTGDGFVATPCNKSANFIEQYGNTTTCLGDVTVLKGNKNIFPNSSITWDFGDGGIVSGDNTPQYTYNAPGTYDVNLSITYNDQIISKSYSMDDVQSGYDNLETIVETKIIEGTMDELNAVNATNITLHLDDGNHSVELDTLFYRGEYQETYYLAYYDNNCVASITKENFITVLPVSASNTANSYQYSFESGGLDNDFIIFDNPQAPDWSFNVSTNPHWEHVGLVGSHGSSSIMIDGKQLTGGDPIIFETQSYNLSDLTEPAISFDFLGAAVSSFPVNYLSISYSKECGIWKDLATISAEHIASAGYYKEDFVPSLSSVWNDTVMFDRIGSNDLKSDNVRFRFTYFVQAPSNRLYIDNIRIGEADDLSLNQQTVNRIGLSTYPNPSKEKTNIIFNLQEEMDLEIKIYNILGSEVSNFSLLNLNAGYHSYETSISDFEEGIYFISIFSKHKLEGTTKLIIQ